jgi:hypothetical protein
MCGEECANGNLDHFETVLARPKQIAGLSSTPALPGRDGFGRDDKVKPDLPDYELPIRAGRLTQNMSFTPSWICLGAYAAFGLVKSPGNS